MQLSLFIYTALTYRKLLNGANTFISEIEYDIILLLIYNS